MRPLTQCRTDTRTLRYSLQWYGWFIRLKGGQLYRARVSWFERGNINGAPTVHPYARVERSPAP